LPQLASDGARLIRVDAQPSRVRRRSDNILTLEPFIALLCVCACTLAFSLNLYGRVMLNFTHGFVAGMAPLSAQVPKVDASNLKAAVTSNNGLQALSTG